MKNLATCLVAALSLSVPHPALANHDAISRPKIMGIVLVRLSATNLSTDRQFYSTAIGDPSYGCHWCELDEPGWMRLGSGQILTFVSPKQGQPSEHVYSIVFATDDAEAMRKYLEANNVQIEDGIRDESKATKKRPGRPAPSTQVPTHRRFLCVRDPEGHRVECSGVPETFLSNPHTNDLRIIHVGIIVNDVAAEDHFYKDILGFHMYWHGGRQDGKDDGVALQVPDGTDGIEYMLNIPAGASPRTAVNIR